jgi:hypothetical protein
VSFTCRAAAAVVGLVVQQHGSGALPCSHPPAPPCPNPLPAVLLHADAGFYDAPAATSAFIASGGYQSAASASAAGFGNGSYSGGGGGGGRGRGGRGGGRGGGHRYGNGGYDSGGELPCLKASALLESVRAGSNKEAAARLVLVT